MFATEAFILDYKDVGELDRQYFLLTREAGLIQAIGKSVLKPKSKLVGHLELLNLVWLEIVDSARGWQITQALERDSFRGLRENLLALRVALRAARFLNDFLPSERLIKKGSQSLEPLADKTAERIFFLWQDFLNQLETGAEAGTTIDFEFLYSQFILRALDILGFLPSLFSCAECGRVLEGENFLFFQTNFICLHCAREKSLSGQVVSSQTLLLMKQILASSWFFQAETAQLIKLLSNNFLVQAYRFML